MYYVGKKSGGRRWVFSATRTPTQQSHRQFHYVEGPFFTKRGATEFARIWNAGGQVTQELAEHWARQAAHERATGEHSFSTRPRTTARRSR